MTGRRRLLCVPLALLILAGLLDLPCVRAAPSSTAPGGMTTCSSKAIWDLKVILPGQAVREFKALKNVHPQWKQLDWLGFCSTAQDRTVFYCAGSPPISARNSGVRMMLLAFEPLNSKRPSLGRRQRRPSSLSA